MPSSHGAGDLSLIHLPIETTIFTPRRAHIVKVRPHPNGEAREEGGP